jgi:hypothetical protein
MSRESAKLFRKSTYKTGYFEPRLRKKVNIVFTKFDIAVLNKTSKVSSCAERSILWTPVEMI